MELIKIKHKKHTFFWRGLRNEPYKWNNQIHYTVKLTKKEFDILLEALQNFATEDKAKYEKETRTKNVDAIVTWLSNRKIYGKVTPYEEIQELRFKNAEYSNDEKNIRLYFHIPKHGTEVFYFMSDYGGLWSTNKEDLDHAF